MNTLFFKTLYLKKRFRPLFYVFFLLLAFSGMVPVDGQNPYGNDFVPVAVPMLPSEEAEKINKEAIFKREMVMVEKKKNERSSVVSSKNAQTMMGITGIGAPTAIPVLSSEEAEKNNKEAIEIRKREIQNRFITNINIVSNNYLSLLIALIPLLLISDRLFKTKHVPPNEKKWMHYLSWERRVFLLSSISLFVFGIMAFVPWSVYFGNCSQFPFIFQDFLNINLVLISLSIVGLFIILLAIPPVISNYLTAILAGFGLCFYCQSMFMNCFLGELNGIEPQWNQHQVWGITNIGIWSVIIITPLVLRFLVRNLWKRIISLTAGTVLLLEIIAVVSMVISAPDIAWERKNNYFIDANKQFEFSSEKNIYVLVLDALGSGYLHYCFKTTPELKDVLKDFTWYTDARSNYDFTFPALLHELTGTLISPCSFPDSNDLSELYKNTWRSSSAQSFYKQISDAGYTSNLYIRSSQHIGQEECYQQYFSNVCKGKIVYTIDFVGLYQCLIQMSGFSSTPYIFKKHFFYDHTFAENIVQEQTNQKLVVIPQNNDSYYNTMISKGITLNANTPILSFHYSAGAHIPWNTDEKCRPHSPAYDDPLPTIKGCIFLISELVQLLKEKNIYDKTAILICSDHGSHGEKYLTPFDMTLMIKPFNTSQEELREDSSKIQSIDILPSLLELACGDSADYSSFSGFPASRIPEDRKRMVYEIKSFSDIPGKRCVMEFLFEDVKTFNRKNSFVRIIPLNQDANVDNAILTKYR